MNKHKLLRQQLLHAGLQHKHHRRIQRLRELGAKPSKRQSKLGRAIKKQKQRAFVFKHMHSYNPELFYSEVTP